MIDRTAAALDPTEPCAPRFYSWCVWLSLFVFIVRPGEIFLALAPAKPALVSFGLLALAFFAAGGPSKIQAMAPAGAKWMKWWLIWGLVVIPFSPYTMAAFESWRMGLAINTALYFLWLPAVRTALDIRRLLMVASISGGCLVLTMQSESLPGQISRLSTGAFYDPNDMAMVLGCLFPLTVCLFFQGHAVGKLLWGSLLVLFGFGIFSTVSRGGTIAFAAGSAMFLFTGPAKIRLWQKFLIVALVVGFFLSPAAESFKERWTSVASGDDYNLTSLEEGGGGRMALWQLAAKTVARRPITGVGTGNSVMGMWGAFSVWKAVHNAYLQIAVDLGLVGLALFLWLLWLIWRNCREAERVFAGTENLQAFALMGICIRVGLVTYMIAATFLSQCYSILVPVLLLISEGVHYIAREADGRSDATEADESVLEEPLMHLEGYSNGDAVSLRACK